MSEANARDHAMRGVLLTSPQLVSEVRRLAALRNIEPKHALAQLVMAALAQVPKESP